MSYQALARKWRPKTFSELVGQEHVVTALTNALTRNRLHHAYLLTGTRGVGKTTIARILAKSLNCITNGITATPCGTCAACMDIDAGRFVDLLELDAASNTGIDNMREVLDNARYMPTVGRFKVYLIDEVHMLSKAAFNSMLKTLEEPPEHVKFVLATTDPQKIPVTVLSRCLQFNLKQLSPALIADRLTADPDGGEHRVRRAGARADRARRAWFDARRAVAARPGHRLRRRRRAGGRRAHDAGRGRYRVRVPDRRRARRQRRAGAARRGRRDGDAQHRVRVGAGGPRVAVPSHRRGADRAGRRRRRWTTPSRVAALAARLAPETVQLAYQICVQGRADLPLAPDEATGFSMTLLRLLAFEPGGGAAAATGEGSAAATPAARVARTRAAGAAPAIGATGHAPARRATAPAERDRLGAGARARRAAPAGRAAERPSPDADGSGRVARIRDRACALRRWRRSSPPRPSSSRSRAMC